MTTRAEYLTSRGWIKAQGSAPDWYDPINNRGTDTATAVTIQRARDAADERAAWVRFAAGALQSLIAVYAKDETVTFGAIEGWSATHADEVAELYRARFAAPARFDDEVTP